MARVTLIILWMHDLASTEIIADGIGALPRLPRGPVGL